MKVTVHILYSVLHINADQGFLICGDDWKTLHNINSTGTDGDYKHSCEISMKLHQIAISCLWVVWQSSVRNRFTLVSHCCFSYFLFLVVAHNPSYAKGIDCFLSITMHHSVSFFYWLNWSAQLVSMGPDSSSAQKQDHGDLRRSIPFIEAVNIHQSHCCACIMYNVYPGVGGNTIFQCVTITSNCEVHLSK